MHSRSDPPGDTPDLYELFVRMSPAPDANGDRVWRDAILTHAEFAGFIGLAGSLVLGRYRERDDLRADVAQQTTLLVARRLPAARARYRDLGAVSFRNWAWKMIAMATRRAWRQCLPFWIEHAPLLDRDVPDKTFTRCAGAVAWEDVQAAIGRIVHRDMRCVLEDLAQGHTIEASARLRNLSTTTAWRLQRDGIEHLRNVL